MKRLLLPLLLFVFAGTFAQGPPSGKYPLIQIRTNQLGEYFREINLPVRGSYDTASISGQWDHAGVTIIDTVNHLLLFKSGDQHYHIVGAGGSSSSTLQQIFDNEVAKALLNKNDSIDIGANQLTFTNGTTKIGGTAQVGARLTYPWSSNPINTAIFTSSGTAPTTPGTNTTINGTNTLTSVIHTGAENFTITFTAITNAKSSVKQNVSLAIVSDTASSATTRKITWALADTAGYMNWFNNDGATTPVSSNRGSNVYAWSAADTLDFTYIYRRGIVTSTVVNHTNGMSSNFYYETGGSTGNVGQIKLITEGNFTYIGNLVYTIDEPYQPQFVITGNSTDIGAGATTQTNRWVSKLFEKYNSTYVVHAGAGERSAQGIFRIDEIVNSIKPHYVIYPYGVNDLNGGSIALFSANARRFADSMNAHGIGLIFLSLVPQVASVQTYNDTIQAIATAKGGRYINITSILQTGVVSGNNKNTLYQPSGDLVHVNDVGQKVQADKIEDGILELLTVKPPLVYEAPIGTNYAYLLGLTRDNKPIAVPDGLSTKYIRDKQIQLSETLANGENKGIFIQGGITAGGSILFPGITGSVSAGQFEINAITGQTIIRSVLISNNLATSSLTTTIDGASSGRLNLTNEPEINSVNSGLHLVHLNGSVDYGIRFSDNGVGNIASSSTYQPLQVWINNDTRKVLNINRGGGIHGDSASGYTQPYSYSALGANDWPTKTHVDSLLALVSGGGTANSNLGSFYRWLVPSSQGIKGAAPGLDMLIDSSSNANSLTFKVDTATMFPQVRATITGGGGGSGVTTMGAFGSTPNANGASISSTTLTLQPADGTNPGGLSTTTQTIAGAKTFSSNVNTTGTKYLISSTQMVLLPAGLTNTQVYGTGGGSLSHTTGNEGNFNTLLGTAAGNAMTTGSFNTAIGSRAMGNATVTGSANVAVGEVSLFGLTSGVDNVAVGNSALQTQSTASASTGVGWKALLNANGANLVGLGSEAGQGNTTGGSNMYIGPQSGYFNQTGSNNVYVGGQAGVGVTGNSHSDNTGIGFKSLFAILTGGDNTANGYQSLINLTTGGSNTVMGANSGGGITTGSFNTIIGDNAGSFAAGQSGTVVIVANALRRMWVNSSGQAIIGGSIASSSDTVNRAATVTANGTFKIESIPLATSIDSMLTIEAGLTKSIDATGWARTASTGLTNTTGTWTNDRVTGKAGGGTVVGGTAANDILLIRGTLGSSGNTGTNTNMAGIVGDGAGTTAWLAQNNGTFQTRYLTGTTSIGTITAGTGAGTSPTLSVTGTDMGGNITVLTGTVPTLSAAVATVAFGNTFPSAPKAVILTPANLITAALSGIASVYIDQANITTSGFVMTAGATALTGATTYKWFYTVIL